MEYKNIIYEIKDKIAYITFNRPEALNALNDALLAELKDCVEGMYKDQYLIRGVILTGAGRSFVAGADISELLIEKPGESEVLTERAMNLFENTHRLFERIEQYPHPVIAAINGFALGGGCELALSCDFRIASTKAKLGLPEPTLGVIPGYGGTQRLPRLIGTSVAKELLFTARQVTAEEAKSIGLVNKVVEPEELISTCEELLHTIISRSATAIRFEKIAVNRGMEMPLQDALRFEKALIGLSFTNDDAKEGIAAFLEKRPAKFTGK